ncbi:MULTISPECIES: hypothetical protein [Streptomyces]
METGAGARDQAEAAREEIAELTALLDGYDKAVEEVRITRKALPDHPAYQQITAVFSTVDSPLRARYGRPWTWRSHPNNINHVRLKLKRPADRGILLEPEQGRFTQPRP